MKWRDLETFSFGDNPKLADELSALVLDGRKCATCWAASDGKSTAVGKRMVMLDGSSRPRVFAYDEGEDDRTLSSWRKAHRAYFGRRGQFAEDMLLWCERFRVVEHVDGEEGAAKRR
jgi:uncharacterized protein YhfF